MSFGGSGSLELLMASKEGAIASALTSLAADIASDIAGARGVVDDPDEPYEPYEPNEPEATGQEEEKPAITEEPKETQ